MCGRFTNRYSWRELHDLYGLTSTPANLQARFNIAPSQMVPVIRHAAKGGRELVSMRWGLIPAWAKDEQVGFSTISARAETVATKPTFRAPFRSRRCIIPASGFYEWQKAGRTKQPFHIQAKDGQPLSLAGLWERWTKGEQPVESFTIIVTEANDLMRPIHDRMPVILEAEDWGRWLGEEQAEPAVLEEMLKPYPSDKLEAVPVGTAVNNVRNEGAELLAPSGGAQQGFMFGE